jgi:NAD(P)-dependent dehydrogenase (short-subunit alcohol dehydrogenase family)
MRVKEENMKRLQDKVALITGGGGGIGGAIAVAYARERANVCICDLNEKGLDDVLENVKKEGVKGKKFIVDVSDSAAVDQMVKDIVSEFGSVDILVNTAGTFHVKSITDIEDESWDRTIKVHLYGTFYCTRAVLRESMLQKNTGRIINIASLSPYTGGPPRTGVAEYSAAKGGIVGFNKAVAKEVAYTDINVNAIAPGYINTPMTSNLYSDGPIKEALETWKIAKGRVGTPDDLVGTAIFLAGDDSTYMTGQVLFVDGGSIG